MPQMPAKTSKTMTPPAVLSVINAKGGVGKTTTTLNIGAGLARAGYRVLLIDIDLQQNLTQSLVGDLAEGEANIAEVLLGTAALDDLVRPTTTPGLFLVPAGETLVGLDITLAGAMAREQILRNCLQEAARIREFDVVLIDNPPNISLATVNSVVASSHYLVPVSCEMLPLYGIRLLFENIEKIKRILNPDLALLGVVLTLYDRREGITERVEETLRRQLGDAVFDTVIRVNTKYKSTALSRQTIFEYEQNGRGKGSTDYHRLTDEVLVRLQGAGVLPVAAGAAAAARPSSGALDSEETGATRNPEPIVLRGRR